ncbi:MAG: hypothetical protein JRH05_07965 [Deltaproteobacteria bacterium]|nr:hypothetical protein [Deltaproteobacteria bacterium]
MNVVIVADTSEGHELYDRKKDPYQLRNLLAERPNEGMELHRLLLEYMLRLHTSQDS